MAILKMGKYRIAVQEQRAQEMVAYLQSFGIAELSQVKDERLQKNEVVNFDHHRNVSRLDTTVLFLSKFQTDSSLKALLEGGRIYTSEEEMEKLVKNFDFETVVDTVQDMRGELNEIDRNYQQLAEEERLLQAWERLTLPLNQSLETGKTLSLPLRGTVRSLNDLQAHLETKTKYISFLKVSDTTLVLTHLKEEDVLINDAINAFGLEKVFFPQKENTIMEALTRIKGKQEELVALKEKMNQEMLTLAQQHVSKLKVVSDYYLWKKQQSDISQAAPGTKDVKIFEAWMPLEVFQTVKDAIEKKITFFAIEPCAPHEGEVTPTEIKNSKTIGPFETITRLYGLPTTQDLDPTPFLSIFFFIFFSLCLGDVGYGLILMLTTGFLISRYRLESSIKQLLTLLFYGGVGSLITGLFLGGYTGIDIANLPPLLRDFQLVDPVKSPLPIFYLSLSLGFIHIVFGICLKLWRQIKFDTMQNAVLDNGPWLLLFFGLILLLLSYIEIFSGIISLQNAHFINWFIYASLGLIVVTQGRTEKNILAKLFFGVLALYSLVGYFSDVLSYSRILALGLATTALSFSINLIAVFIGSLLPSFLGMIVTIIILILGHALNLAIGIMSAFIHSARLQFVEFFSKFLIGSGRTFRPFLREQRNVILVANYKE